MVKWYKICKLQWDNNYKLFMLQNLRKLYLLQDIRILLEWKNIGKVWLMILGNWDLENECIDSMIVLFVFV